MWRMELRPGQGVFRRCWTLGCYILQPYYKQCSVPLRNSVLSWVCKGEIVEPVAYRVSCPWWDVQPPGAGVVFWLFWGAGPHHCSLQETSTSGRVTWAWNGPAICSCWCPDSEFSLYEDCDLGESSLFGVLGVLRSATNFLCDLGQIS